MVITTIELACFTVMAGSVSCGIRIDPTISGFAEEPPKVTNLNDLWEF